MLAVKFIIYDNLCTEFHLNFIKAARRMSESFYVLPLSLSLTLISHMDERRPVKSVSEVWV